MRIRSKRLIKTIGSASIILLASGVAVPVISNSQNVVHAAKKKKSVNARSYGVDVAVYQSSSVKSSANAGSQFAIVKVSEGTSYRNPKASAQIASAQSNSMLPMAYHFALFGANKSRAVAEAKYAVASAQASGLPKGSYIACDWETGDGNVVTGGKTASANAIIAFMQQIKDSGYQPLLYSGAYLLNHNINTAKVTNAFPNSLWVASYASMGRIDTPNFSYFPSMNGVIIWQFTDNWRGLNVDGNISLLPLSINGSASSQAPSTNEVSTGKTVMHKAYVYDQNGQRVAGKSYAAYTKVQVIGGMVAINGVNYYQVGENSYIKVDNVDGTKRILKNKAFVYNKKGKLVSSPAISQGTTVSTYGGTVTINGDKYYRIQKNRYIKASDF